MPVATKSTSRLLAAAFVLLVVGGPVLVFPDLLPVWRTGVVTLLTLAALGLGVVMLHPWKAVRLGLWLFILAVVASWIMMPVHDLLGVRHFAGLGFGVLAMAVLANWCTNTDRLIAMALLFAIAATGVLFIGLLATPVTTAKLVARATPIMTGEVFPWLPRFQLDLPGLETNSGMVNANALGGTALMLLPTCAALVMAAVFVGRCRRSALFAGVIATTVATVVLGMVRSRTALIAALLTVGVLALRWRRGRWWLFASLLFCAVGLSYTLSQSAAAAPDDFADGVRFMRRTVEVRVMMWQDGLERLRETPWLGVGINQFHESPNLGDAGGATHIAHAHNMFLQVALDVGLLGLTGYLVLMGTLVLTADRLAIMPSVAGRVAGGAGLSLVAVHCFGLADAIALGSKVGLFQWLCAGLILAAARMPFDARLLEQGRSVEPNIILRRG